jgi:hypothetical protein
MHPDPIDNWIDRHEAAKLLRCSADYLRDKATSCGRTGCVEACCQFKAFPQIRRTFHLHRYLLWGPDVEAVRLAALAPPPPPKPVEKPKFDLSMYAPVANVPGGAKF